MPDRGDDWSSLIPAIETGEADAAIASIRITAEALKSADFTLRYYATPARFAARKESEITDIRPETIKGLKIGVAKGSGHEAYLKTFFPGAPIAAFDTSEAAQRALKEGAIDLVFADGVSLAFWFNGVDQRALLRVSRRPLFRLAIFRRGRRHRREKGQPKARSDPELRA